MTEHRNRSSGASWPARPGDKWKAPDGLDREEAYERAGRCVVDRCDAIIASGTARVQGPGRNRGNRRLCPGAGRSVGVGPHWEGPPVSCHSRQPGRGGEGGGRQAAHVQYRRDRQRARSTSTSRTASRTDAGHGQGNPNRPLGLSRVRWPTASSRISSAPISRPCAISVASGGSARLSSSWPPWPWRWSPSRRIPGPRWTGWLHSRSPSWWACC